MANVYLNDLDRVMAEEMVRRRREGKWERVIYTRYADDIAVLIDSHPRWQPPVAAIKRRLEVELKKVKVELNEEKTRVVDLSRGGILGF